MKTIKTLLALFIILFWIAFPIYLAVSTICLYGTLPNWYGMLNFIGAFILIILLLLVIIIGRKTK